MEKRGVVEIHFNWIFVIIAGAIIFLFFINIVNKQRKFSEIKTSSTIITNLESILTGAQVSTATVNIVDMPRTDIGFECDRYFIGPVPKQTKGNIIFAPDLLKGKKIITWALDWNLPYRVANFLFITDPELRYIIVNNQNDIGRKIFDELPKEMNKELTNPNDIQKIIDKNNYKVKFIFLGNVELNNVNANGLKTLGNMPDKDVTAINLIDIGNANVIPNTGTIKFLRKKGTIWETQKFEGKEETYYIKKEALFGAIFAADINVYNCIMKKAFKRLNLVSKIYKERSSDLANYYGITNSCFAPHDASRLSYMEQYSNSQKNFPTSKEDVDSIQTTSTGIKEQNQRAQLYSCALIY